MPSSERTGSGCRTIREVRGPISSARGSCFFAADRPRRRTCGDPSLPRLMIVRGDNTSRRGLARPEVRLTGLQAKACGEAFAETSRMHDVAVHALSIMPQHVHVVFGRAKLTAETIVRLLKAEASRRLTEQNLHPRSQGSRDERGRLPTPWAKSCWVVFLSNGRRNPSGDANTWNAIHLKDGLPQRQTWKFVQPYIGIGLAAAP